MISKYMYEKYYKWRFYNINYTLESSGFGDKNSSDLITSISLSFSEIAENLFMNILAISFIFEISSDHSIGTKSSVSYLKTSV